MAQPVTGLTKLRWTLFTRGFKGNINKTIGAVILAIYGALGLLTLFVALAATVFESHDAAEAVTSNGAELAHSPMLLASIILTAVALVWILLPLLDFGADSTFLPQHFAQYGRSAREMRRPLFISAAAMPAFLYTAVVVLLAVLAQMVWFGLGLAAGFELRLFAAFILAPVAGVMVWCFALVAAQAVQTWRVTRVLSKQRREMLLAVSLLAIVVVVYGGMLAVQAMSSDFLHQVQQIGLTLLSVLSWSPLGAPAFLPYDVAAGNWWQAAVRVLVWIVGVLLLLRVWEVCFTKGQTMALATAAGDKKLRVKALIPAWLPQNQIGAVAAKSLLYWRRDTRYGTAVIIMPIMAAVLIAMSVVNADGGVMAYGAVLLVAWMAGITLSNEIGFDGPSSWVNITAGIDNRANLLGRYLAAAVLLGPIALATAVIAPIASGTVQYMPLAICVVLGVILACWGVSMLASAFLPYPAPAPGQLTKSSGSSFAWLSMLSITFGVWIPMLPAFICIALGLTILPALEWLGAFLALIFGVAAFWFGLVFAAKRLDSSYPEAFQRVKHFC